MNDEADVFIDDDSEQSEWDFYEKADRDYEANRDS